MAKVDSEAAKRERRKTMRWVTTIFFVTIFVSGFISFLSDEIMAKSNIFVAFLILLAIVMIGIIFDIIGVAVTSADEKPFHSMAARKVPGAHEAIRLLRNAERVSSWWEIFAALCPAPLPQPLRQRCSAASPLPGPV